MFRAILTLLRPGGANRLADQQRRVGAFSRDELLRAAAPHFRGIQVAVLVHAELVRAPESAGLGCHRAPGVQQLSVQVVFVELEVAVAV
jgi:hypothetical protein